MTEPTASPIDRWEWATLAASLIVVASLYFVLLPRTEPFYNGDETRHVATGIFVRDALKDRPFTKPTEYAKAYFLQYPALGLLQWPPLFYFFEGIAMTAFGAEYEVGRALVALFGLLACLAMWRMVRFTHGPHYAAAAMALFGCGPLFLELGSRIMLEVSATCWAMLSIFHFERYLKEKRRGDVWAACLFAAFSPLTRYDGVILLPYFLLRLLMGGPSRWALLKRPAVIGAILMALALTAPYYLFAYREYGAMLSKTAAEGTDRSAASGAFAIETFLYYLKTLPVQIGWPVTILGVIGFITGIFDKDARARLTPYWVWMAVVYLFFCAMVQVDARHVIYWFGAWAALAIEGLRFLAKRFGLKPMIGLAVSAMMATAWTTSLRTVQYVNGYEEAAKYVLEAPSENPVCMVDAYLDGNFIFQLRRHDRDKRMWILRADKVIYSMNVGERGGYAEYAKTPDDVIALIQKFGVEYLVIEQPKYEEMPAGADLVRRTIAEHPERFRLEATFPIQTNHPKLNGLRIEIYRNLQPNRNRDPNIRFHMLNLQRELQLGG